MWWGRTYNGVTPIVNFINLLFMVMREDVADIIRKRQYDGLIPGFRVDDVMLDFEKALSNIIFEGKLEKSVSDIKASLISDLKRELARHNDHQLTYVLNNAIDRL